MQRIKPTSEKKKVGIISLFGLYNFGNRLQGYALDRVLRDMGFIPETVVLFRKLGVSICLSKFRKWMKAVRGETKSVSRDERFQQFVAGQSIRYIFVPSQIKSLSNQYDFFCVGSDQVWNPDADLFPHTKLLQFAKPSQRIAVAPSFGVKSLPKSSIGEYKQYLNAYKALSAREEEGAMLIESLIGEKPQVIVDPTLALTADQWRQKESQDVVPSTPYVLVYFLGGWTGALGDYIEVGEDRSEKELQVIDLLDNGSPYYGSGPQDFLGLIDSADLVLTDSFHASVFSIIFGVPFRVYKRQESTSTYSRIRTLLETYRITGVEGFGPMPNYNANERVSLENQLNKQRERFIKYLKEALDA